MDGQTDITLYCDNCGNIQQFNRFTKRKECNQCGHRMEDDGEIIDEIYERWRQTCQQKTL